MCLRLWGWGGLMACDLPVTAMTLLTYLICLSHWQTTKHTHTHTLFLVCTKVASTLAGVPQFP